MNFFRILHCNFSKDIFEAAEFWFIVGLTAILRLLQTPLLLICSFHCCLMKVG